MLNSSITMKNFPLDYMGNQSIPYGTGSFFEENHWKLNIKEKIKKFNRKTKKVVFEEVQSRIFDIQVSRSNDKEDDIRYVEELSDFDKVLNNSIEKIYKDRRTILGMQEALENHRARCFRNDDYDEVASGLDEIVECCEQIVNAYNDLEDFLNELHSKSF
ncbi:MAG: hypothetical protein IKD77_00015 [Bacilli bacterium]|nr:hypothetical protein [Bacilli bacterium]